jgi:hypothetical protein
MIGLQRPRRRRWPEGTACHYRSFWGHPRRRTPDRGRHPRPGGSSTPCSGAVGGATPRLGASVAVVTTLRSWQRSRRTKTRRVEATMLNFAICDLQKRGGRATVPGYGHAEHVSSVAGNARGAPACPRKPPELFLRPSRLALMARTPEQRAKRAEQARARRATSSRTGPVAVPSLATSERDRLLAIIESLVATLGRFGATAEATKGYAENVAGYVAERSQSVFLPASDASHNRAHAPSDLISPSLPDHENTKKAGSYVSGQEDLSACAREPQEATSLRVAGYVASVAEATRSPGAGGENFFLRRAKSKSEMARLLDAKPMTDAEHRAEVRRQQEAALRWAAEQERRGAAE